METTRDVGAVGTGLWNIRQTVPEGRQGGQTFCCSWPHWPRGKPITILRAT